MTTATATPPDTSLRGRDCRSTCPYHRIGLPILPVRYGLVRSPNLPGLRKLEGPLAKHEMGVESIAIDSEDPYGYALRTLRTGWVYVFDENRGELDVYQVSDRGFLFRHTLWSTEQDSDAPLPCSDVGHQGAASLITIPNANRATKPVWISYSPVRWTMAVEDEHRSDGALRERHMVKFDPAQWLGGNSHDGAAPIQEVGRHVLELSYLSDSSSLLRRALPWAALPRAGGDSLARMIQHSAERLAPGKGLLLALPDPEGIASDLAEVMNHELESYIESYDSETRRKIAVCEAIEKLEFVVREDAENRLTNRLESQAREWEIEQWRGNSARPANPERAREIRARLNQDALDRAADAAWSTHAGRKDEATGLYIGGRYDENARRAWREGLENRLSEFYQAVIDPLATAHCQWMQSKSLAEHFACNFDCEDARSGGAYIVSLSACIGSTQDKAECAKLYTDWLQTDSDDNPIQRALGYNQTQLLQPLEASSSYDWASLPWGNFAAAFTLAARRVGPAETDAMGAFIARLSGPIERTAMKAASSGVVYRSLVKLGTVTEQPMVVVEIRGTGRDFWRHLARSMIELTGEPVSEHRMRAAVVAQMRGWEARGVPMNSVTSNKWLVAVNEWDLRAMPEHLRGPEQMQARITWLASRVHDPDALRQLGFSAWKSRMQRASPSVNRAISVGGGTILGALLSHASLSSLQGEMSRSLAHQRPQVQRRILTQYTLISGIYAEAIGEVAEKVGRGQLAMRSSERVRSVGTAIRKLGRGLGVFGGILLAAYDVHEGFRAIQRGDERFGRAQVLVGALSGVVVFLMIIVGSFWLILTASALIMVASLVLDYFRPSRSELWLERCYSWGRLGPDGWYRTERDEQRDFVIALGN
ncbi:T6SS effector BTH_I2691 family protein [Alkalisalibacterium limincola]|uniref:Toxin VasX N-terminal region domain-containing protein n=1 Tax=Alkalisalibacterium limincola TaxID=2699169 RepID=A0A5C8KLC2_9GAMM|nr:T6SS effector BTH_I2691 family protein [Alkalisalibacterium limincola]TXK61039.1 hypothetical protein FU658_10730 [Alkalisalibacterium limincola]